MWRFQPYDPKKDTVPVYHIELETKGVLKRYKSRVYFLVSWHQEQHTVSTKFYDRNKLNTRTIHGLKGEDLEKKYIVVVLVLCADKRTLVPPSVVCSCLVISTSLIPLCSFEPLPVLLLIALPISVGLSTPVRNNLKNNPTRASFQIANVSGYFSSWKMS